MEYRSKLGIFFWNCRQSLYAEKTLFKTPENRWGGAYLFLIHMKRILLSYQNIISVENLFLAWKEFSYGKINKKDVQLFSLRLMANIFRLHDELERGTYKHGSYRAFNISDPKPRNIHKASVRDRVLHHAVYRVLYPEFDKKFIYDSFSCRRGKGPHEAIARYQQFFWKVSKENTKTCHVLKCDIRKFFASIDHEILMSVLRTFIQDINILILLENIIVSFHTKAKAVGLPLGNLTSQLLVNIFMNEFDQFVKHELRIQCYIRYADDFVVLSDNRICLEKLIPKMQDFLERKLELTLHPNKVFIKTAGSGLDFLGWVHFPDHRILRTSTKRRVLKKMNSSPLPATIASYKGLLKHGNTRKIQDSLPIYPA